MCLNRAYCWNTKPALRVRAGMSSQFRSAKRTLPLSANSNPPRMRNRVVLPDPEGPSREMKPPWGATKLAPFRAAKRPNFLDTESTFNIGFSYGRSGSRRRAVLMTMNGGQFVGIAPFQQGFQGKGDQGKQGQQSGNGKGADIIVIVVEQLDMQRHGVGLSPDMA